MRERERDKDARYVRAVETAMAAAKTMDAAFRKLIRRWAEVGVENQRLRGGGKPRAFSTDSADDANEVSFFVEDVEAR